MYLSTTHSDNFLKALCGINGSVTFVPSGACYLGLYTTVPGANGTGGVEVATPGSNTKNYARVEISGNMSLTYKSASLGESVPTTHTRRIGNASDINYNAAIDTTLADPDQSVNSAWGEIKGIGIFSAATGGTPVAWAAFDPADYVTVAAKNSFHFYAGRFEIYIDDAGNIAATASAGA